MSYLHINGYAIPIESCEPTHQHIAASMGYSPNGVYQLSRNGYARAWKCRSGLLTTAERHAMMAILGHRGDGWRFNLSAASDGVVYITDATSPEVYSDKFKVPKSAEAVATIMAAYGADGARVYDWNGNPYGPFDGSTGSVLVEPGTTNLFAETTYNCQDHTVFTLENASTGASKADATDRYWESTQSIKLITGANTGDGIRTPNVTSGFTVGLSTTVSVFVAGGSGGEQVRIVLQQDTGGGYATIGTPSSFTLPSNADSWTRIYTTETISGSAVGLRVLVLNAVASAQTWYVDGFQLEQPTDGYPTAPVDPGENPWGSGSGVRPNGILDYDNFFSAYMNGFSACSWVNYQKESPAANQFLYRSGTTQRALMLTSTANLPSSQILSTGGSALSVNGAALSTGWNNFVQVYDRDANTMYFYLNGAFVSSDSSWSGARQYFDVENTDGDFSIGSAGVAGSNMAPGPIGSFQVLPYAIPATVIAGMYDSAQQARLPPGVLTLSVHGDALQLGERWIQATATLDAAPHNPWWNGPTFESGGGRVAFTLNEAVRRSA